MAKKKKKQNPAKQVKNKMASNPLRQQEEAVRRVYHSYMKDVNKRRAENQRFYGGVDYDTGRVKRRIAATAATMEEFKSRCAESGTGPAGAGRPSGAGVPPTGRCV